MSTARRLLLVSFILIAASAEAGMFAKRPAASQFGLGPRNSSEGCYSATLLPAQPLKTRVLQTIEVSIRDAGGRPVEGASIVVDGGMSLL